MKKIISYSLYNSRPKDVVNAVVNCFLAKKIYKDWICRFYVDNTIPNEIRLTLTSFDNVEIVDMPTNNGPSAMFWRFLPASDDDVDVMISRDADSWLSNREFVCVNEFLNSDKTFHIIRDHCYHSQKIMGGVWGVKKGVIPNMKELVEDYISKNNYDQGFLGEVIYPKVINNSLIHLGDQHDRSGNKTNGYFNDGGIPIPNYEEIPIENFSFSEVNRLNGFHCLHCRKTHDVFIGGIMNRIPQQTKNYLMNYFNSLGINSSIINGV